MKIMAALLALLLVLGGGVFSGLSQVWPAAVPANAAQDPAYAQVMQDLAYIAEEPHPAGSVRNALVRNFILEQTLALTSRYNQIIVERQTFEIDVESFVQQRENDISQSDAAYQNRIARQQQALGLDSVADLIRYNLAAEDLDVLQLENILVKIDSPYSEEAVMFVCHYDSVRNAPGAGDDGLALACTLQLMRQLADTQLNNDVYLLITDGEEQGLLGAHNFVQAYPQYQQEVKLLFNFEARGNAGALLMFETSANNYGMVHHFQKAVPRPVSFSLATAIYENMPNGTDFTPFKNAGYPGLNFAIIEGAEHYHQATDDMPHLNPNTAWHYWQTVSALGEYFSHLPLSQINHNQNALFFPLFGSLLVLPGWLGQLLGYLPVLLALLLVVYAAIKKKRKDSALVEWALPLLLLTLLPCVATMVFFPGSYLFSLPALFFLGLECCLVLSRRRAKMLPLGILLVTIYALCLLYVPIIYLVQVALQMWYVTFLLAFVPLVPATIYSIRVLRRFKKPKRVIRRVLPRSLPK